MMNQFCKIPEKFIFRAWLCFVIVFSTTSSFAQQWSIQPSITTQNLNSVYFPSTTKGWIAGSAGTIFVTEDGGMTWNAQSSGTTQNLNSICFVSTTQGWAVGNAGTILTTNNGGVTWIIQNSGTAQNLNSVCFVSATQGWAVGNAGTILTTNNSGINWQSQSSSSSQDLNSVYFISSTKGWIVGGGIQTTNDGSNWIYQESTSITSTLRSVYFNSLNQGCTVGDYATVATTVNGGVNWSTHSGAIVGFLRSLYFTSSSEGWTVGNAGMIEKTTNGGNYWVVQSSNTNQQLNSVYFPSTTKGCIVGNNGTILLYGLNCVSPNIITQSGSQAVCAGSQISFAISAVGDGLTYQWKKDNTNISGANSSTLSLTNISATDAASYDCVVTGTCGTITSNAATLTVQTTTAPTTNAQSFCNQSPTVAQLLATGAAIKWYNVSSGGTSLSSSTPLTTGTYYTSQTINSCEGPRASAVVTVQTTPAPTTSAQTFCASTTTLTVSQLTATGTSILWYTASTGGSSLVSNTVLSTGTYYASQTVNGCEGPRAATNVTVLNTSLPSAVAQAFCGSQNPTVANLTATGTAIKWYTTASGGLSLPAIAPLSTATYYASQTVNGCESNRIAVSVTLTSTAYALSNADAVCSSSFAVPLQTVGTIKSGLVGLDFTLTYDQTLVTPTGTASPGPVATAYGDYSLNTSTPGQVVVSVYLKSAPSNTFFNGSGTIISLNFTVKAGVAINSIGTLSTGLIEESTVIGASTSCNATSSTLKVVGVVGGKIIYRDDMTNDLGYDASSPSSYIPTVITGYGSNCSTQVGVPVMPNNTGIFAYYPGNGSTLKIERDVKGDFNLPPLQCANVQSVINSADYQLALTIANSSYTTPSLYELMSADVNQDGKVTAGDVSLISSRSINQYNCEFPQAWNYEWNGIAYVPKSTYTKSKDWLFVPDVYATSPSFVLNMGRNKVPQLPACLPNPPGTASCTANANTIYHALLLGDVNANWTKAANGGQTRESSSYEIVFDLLNAIDNGSSKTIPVYYSGATSFTGIDFSLDYAAGITISGITAGEGISLQWNNIGGQRLMVAAYADQELTGKYPVLYLTVNTEDALTADQFPATAGYLNGEKASLRFDGNTTSGSKEDFFVEIFPNPSNTTTYLYTIDASAFVKVSIYSTNGNLVYENMNVPANENVALPELKAGLYILKVAGNKGEVTKKWVRY